MLLTKELKQWIYSKLYKYAKQIGLSRFELPMLVFSDEELGLVPQRVLATYTVSKAKKCRGVTYLGNTSHNIISFINVEKHLTKYDLLDTVVHELVHVRFPYLEHGSKYAARIDEILAGKEFKPYSPRE